MFNQFKLDKSFNQTRGIFDEFVYSTSDTLEEVTTDGYFDARRFNDEEWKNCIITASTSTGIFRLSVNTEFKVSVISEVNPSSITIDRLLDAESLAASQEPSTTGAANSAQIEFGVSQLTPADPVMISSNGKLTINETGTYRIKISLQFGRSGGAGTSLLLFRVLVNGTQAGRSVAAKIANANTEQYFENDTWITLPSGTELDFEVMRDASGNDSGGLFSVTPTVEAGSWNFAPCAALRVERWK